MGNQEREPRRQSHIERLEARFFSDRKAFKSSCNTQNARDSIGVGFRLECCADRQPSATSLYSKVVSISWICFFPFLLLSIGKSELTLILPNIGLQTASFKNAKTPFSFGKHVSPTLSARAILMSCRNLFSFQDL